MSSRDSYPHPVLGHSDDVDSVIECDFTKRSRTTTIDINLVVRTNDTDLQRLVGQEDDDQAGLVVSWNCPATLSAGAVFPRCVNAQVTMVDGRPMAEWTFQADLDQRTVRGKVDVDVQFTLNRPHTHRWTRQHPDYGGAKFELSVGDVVATCGRYSFDVEKQFDPFAPPDSWFKFQGASIQRGIDLRFDDDERVYVRMPHDMYSEFKSLSGNPRLQIALFALPALMATVEFIKESEAQESPDSARWYSAIKEQIGRTSRGLDATSLEIAQELLEYPIDRHIEQIALGEEEEE